MNLKKIQSMSVGGGHWTGSQIPIQTTSPMASVSTEMQTLLWTDEPSSLDLSNGRVDVWLVHLDQPFSEDSFSGILSWDELNRAGRFRFNTDRLRFARCRSALRFLLGRYLGVSAAEIRFEYQPAGKPELAAQQNPRGLCFNLSHSGRLALIAVSAGRSVGIDIEEVRADTDVPALAEHFFSIRERAGLGSLPECLRLAAFYACWTRKESYLKATGAGLSFPLAEFSVSTHPYLRPSLEEIRGNTEAHRQWSLVDLSVANGYRASIAVADSSFPS